MRLGFTVVVDVEHVEGPEVAIGVLADQIRDDLYNAAESADVSGTEETGTYKVTGAAVTHRVEIA